MFENFEGVQTFFFAKILIDEPNKCCQDLDMLKIKAWRLANLNFHHPWW
jgi:hypothetical protein